MTDQCREPARFVRAAAGEVVGGARRRTGPDAQEVVCGVTVNRSDERQPPAT